MRIPTYDNPTEQLSSGPRARFPVEGAQEYASGQTQDLAKGMMQAGAAIGDIGNEMARQDLIVRKTAAMDMVMSKANALRFGADGKGGYTSLRGGDALQKTADDKPLDEKVGAEFDAGVEEAKKTLVTDQQRRAFELEAKAARQHFVAGVQEHVARQSAVHEENTHLGGVTVANQMMAQAQTADDIKMANNRLLTAYEGLAKIRGITDKDEKQKLLTEVMTPAYGSLIEREIKTGNTVQAATYLERYKGVLNGEVYTKLSEALDGKKTLIVAQEFGDMVSAKGMGMTEAIALAREKFSGEQEKVAVDHVRGIFSEAEYARTLNVKNVTNDAWSYVLANGRVPDGLLGVSLHNDAPEAKRQMIDWLAAKRKRDIDEANGGAKTDFQKYYGLRRMAMESPVQFMQIDLTKSLPYLSGPDFKHLTEIQSAIQKGDVKAMQSQHVIKDAIDGLTPMMRDAGIVLTPKAGTKAAEKSTAFLSELSTRLDQATAAKGHALSKEEAQTIARNALRLHVEQGSGVAGFFKTEKRGWEVAPGNEEKFIVATYNKIPMAQRNEIENQYRLKYRIGSQELNDEQKAEIEKIYTRAHRAGAIK